MPVSRDARVRAMLRRWDEEDRKNGYAPYTPWKTQQPARRTVTRKAQQQAKKDTLIGSLVTVVVFCALIIALS